MGADPQYAKYPFLYLAQDVFNLTNTFAPKSVQQESLESLKNAISEYKMAPLYRYITHPSEGILNENTKCGSQIENLYGRKSNASGMIANKNLLPQLGLHWDEDFYEKLRKENDEALEKFKKEEEEAAEKAGDTEVQAARGQRAEYLAMIGDKVRYLLILNICYRTNFWETRSEPSQNMKNCLKRRVFWELKLILC